MCTAPPAGAASAMPGMNLPPIGAAPAPIGQAPLQLYLQATINGNPLPDLQPFTQREDGLWADSAVLQNLGFRGTVGPARLASLPGVHVSYDAGSQRVAITAPISQLDLATTVVDTGASAPMQASAGSGLLLNYDVYGAHDPKYASVLNAATELRAFGKYGVLGNTMLTSVSHSSASAGSVYAQGGNHTSNVRLDTALNRYWPDSAVKLTVGDTTTSSLSWSRSIRMGGIQIGRDYSLQPYRITTPLPAFMGTAVVPSAVDLYINGIRRYQGNFPAGPFQLDNMPTVTGMGNAQMVLTDALGRQTQVNIPFYASDSLLAPGLTDWGAEAGFIRRRYGYSSFSYASEPAYSGTVRHGLTRNLTLEAHGETTRGTRVAGLGAAASLGLLGQVSGSYANSQGGGQRGQQFSLGYQWQGSLFHLAMNTVRASRDYRDIAAVQDGQPTPRVSESAVAGVNLNQFGSLNVSYVRARYTASANPDYGYDGYGGTDQINRYAGVFWSKTLSKRAMLNVSYNQGLSGARDRSVFVGLNLYLDHNVNLSSTVQRQNNDTSYGASASQWTQDATGWNWTVQGQRGQDTKNGNAEASYRSRYGDFRAGVSSTDDHGWVYGGASGGVVLMNGGVFAGRRVDDGFAVVSTDGVPGVPVKLHNQPAGKTDGHGMLMISPLGAYQKNSISIDPLDLPADMKVDNVEADVAPQRHAGALVSFTLRPVRAASVILHDAAGVPLPVGARVRVNGGKQQAIVGYDGMTYVEDLGNQNTMQVDGPGLACATSFDYTGRTVSAAPIGPLTCK